MPKNSHPAYILPSGLPFIEGGQYRRQTRDRRRLPSYGKDDPDDEPQGNWQNRRKAERIDQ